MPVLGAIAGHFVMCTILKRISLLTCAIRNTYAAYAKKRGRNRLLLNILVIDGEPFVAKKATKGSLTAYGRMRGGIREYPRKGQSKKFCLFGVNTTSSREEHVSIDLVPRDA